MKRSVQILVCLLVVLGCFPLASWGQTLDGANAFITRWQGQSGVAILVPLYGNYAYRWEKADGTVIKADVADVANEGLLELPVLEDGQYVLKAGPAGVKRLAFGVFLSLRNYYSGSRGTPRALLQVVQWGSVAWESFGGAFYGCGNLKIDAGAGTPDLSSVTSMWSAFEDCASFNSPLWAWDVSRVENMREMFRGCSAFNQPLERWDVSKVRNMREMFYRCGSFNQPLGGWRLSALELNQENIHELGLSSIGLSVESYSATLAGWAAQRDQLQSGVRVNAAGLIYNASGKAARQALIDEKQWQFEGDSETASPSLSVEMVDAPAQLYVGVPHAFRANVEPAWVSQEVRWSVEEGDEWGTFSGNVLTAKRGGGITVRATAVASPNLSRSVRFNVVVGGMALRSIAVIPTHARIGIGDTKRLQVSYIPEEAADRSVTWSSSNESVATVNSDGVVTGEQAGTARITATSVSGGHKAICTVSVVPPIALKGITLNRSVRIGLGQTQKLRVGYRPSGATNREIAWSSSDEAVVTVDEEGSVIAMKVGTATITARAADGGYTARCEVTVFAPVALVGIAVSPTSAQLKVDETLQLTASYTPSNATNRSVAWSSSDGSVATVSEEGMVTGAKAGTATITVMSADGGYKAICTVTVASSDRASGVESVQLAGVSVSPNPFDGVLTVHGAEAVVRYALVSATGAEVQRGAHDGGEELTLSTSHLPAGIYWLRLSAGDGDRTMQVVRR